ncbi:IS21 family transposase [Negadavirga shengliensis]|uniref:IS21 family transposase n=1 Tax=Negadavirga shengliensis TaxID=1389218 RepID=A0ABV9T9A0_9BACT
MNVYLNKFMVYFEIHRLRRDGFTIRQISKELVLDRRTVSRYLSMSEPEFEQMMVNRSDRIKVLSPYESFVKSRLETFRDTPAAQMHDWLKERFKDLPKVSPKTVFNFVSWVRRTHNLPFIKTPREYGMVEELPYGKQAQVDFGEYNMRNTSGNRVKVFFFLLTLSRSRFKYVWFTDRHFTSLLAIEAHEKAFAYIGGVPMEIVYDQDKVFMVSENGGDLILTDTFRAYTREQSFDLYFCRKSDPESKGKVENVVRYVKRNFLYNRTFHNIKTLNDEALGWLGRTANALPHGVTKKEPCSEHIIERPYLTPYRPCSPRPAVPDLYAVRKDNSIPYKGNFYSLPLGTYKGKGSRVALHVEAGELVISRPENKTEICRHTIPVGTGQKIKKTDHGRDKTGSIAEKIADTARLFAREETALSWMALLRKEKPRYIRDQLGMIQKAIEGKDPQKVEHALKYCLEKAICSASDFKAILDLPDTGGKVAPKIRVLNPLSGKMPENALIQPEKSNIGEYEEILNTKTKSNK